MLFEDLAGSGAVDDKMKETNFALRRVEMTVFRLKRSNHDSSSSEMSVSVSVLSFETLLQNSTRSAAAKAVRSVLTS